MKMRWVMAAMVLAAMGPGRNALPPEAAPAPAPVPQATRNAVPEPAPAVPDVAASRPAALTVRPAAEVAPGDFLWTARPLVVFADTPDDPAFVRQMADIAARPGPLADRDVVVLTDADPAADTAWRRELRPSGFSLVLIDKDGQVKQRKPAPWDVREITRAIDKFPLRRQEIGRMGVTP